MKKLFKLILVFVLSLSLNSCFGVYDGFYVTTQDDVYIESYDGAVRVSNVDFNVVISAGTPYYYNGTILYYLYNGLYYYPFYYDNYWYVRAYRRPFSDYHRPYFRPNRHDFRFEPGRYRGYDRPPVRHDSRIRPNSKPEPNRRPNVRPDRGNNRVIPDRPANRPNQPNNTRPNVRPNNTRPNNSPQTRTPNIGRSNVSRPQVSSPSGGRSVGRGGRR